MHFKSELYSAQYTYSVVGNNFYFKGQILNPRSVFNNDYWNQMLKKVIN